MDNIKILNISKVDFVREILFILIIYFHDIQALKLIYPSISQSSFKFIFGVSHVKSGSILPKWPNAADF